MRGPIVRCLLTAVAGALAGLVAALLMAASQPGLTLDMDRDVRNIAEGVYGPELSGETTFAWTSGAATFTLAGLDRSIAWHCELRAQGPRPGGAMPHIEVAADGVAILSEAIAPLFEEKAFTVPRHAGQSGLTLTLRTTPTFVPGPQDKRELGVQIDYLRCMPDGRARPPRSVLQAAAAIGGLFGLAIGLAPGSLAVAIAGTVAFAAVAALPLLTGLAPFTPFPAAAIRLAGGVVGAIAILLLLARALRPLHPAAGFVVVFSAAAAFLKLLALLHPAKAPVDIVFHAHRLEWVLDGRFYFSQGLRDAQFPYAIALYVFAAPWAALTSDHVLLLRVVVCVVQAIAGALLYLLVVRHWQNRAVGATAVVLFHLVPLPYVILGNANMTYAFGQAAGVSAIAAATILRLGRRDVWQWLVLFVIASIAFLSHVGTFPLTLGALLVLAALCFMFGGSEMRAPAVVIGATTILAVAFSVAIYWGHFSEVYATFDRVIGRAPAVAAETTPAAAELTTPTPRLERIQAASRLAVYSFGWPLILLFLAGLWRGIVVRCRDRAGLAIAAWLLTCAVAVGASVLMPIDRSFERYADEFITRAYDATIPAIAILGAAAIVWAWRANILLRIVAVFALAASAAAAYEQWIGWIRS